MGQLSKWHNLSRVIAMQPNAVRQLGPEMKDYLFNLNIEKEMNNGLSGEPPCQL